MNKIKLVAIDLAKHCYQVGAFEEHGGVIYNRRYSAGKFALAIQQLEPTVIAMEACAAAHYWGRRLSALGHEVRLVPAQHTKAFRRVHKSDVHDTLSIAEAAQRPNIHFVAVKSIAQQDLQLLGRIANGWSGGHEFLDIREFLDTTAQCGGATTRSWARPTLPRMAFLKEHAGVMKDGCGVARDDR